MTAEEMRILENAGIPENDWKKVEVMMEMFQGELVRAWHNPGGFQAKENPSRRSRTPDPPYPEWGDRPISGRSWGRRAGQVYK